MTISEISNLAKRHAIRCNRTLPAVLSAARLSHRTWQRIESGEPASAQALCGLFALIEIIAPGAPVEFSEIIHGVEVIHTRAGTLSTVLEAAAV